MNTHIWHFPGFRYLFFPPKYNNSSKNPFPHSTYTHRHSRTFTNNWPISLKTQANIFVLFTYVHYLWPGKDPAQRKKKDK